MKELVSYADGVHAVDSGYGRPQLAAIHRCHGKAIPVLAHFRARQAEDLHRHAKLKSTEAVIGQCHHTRARNMS